MSSLQAPCRVSNLVGLSKTQGGGGEIEDARGAGERGQAIYIGSSWHAVAPRPFCYKRRALAFPQVSSSKRAIKLALATQMPRGDSLAHF